LTTTTNFSVDDWKHHHHSPKGDDPVLGHDDKINGKVTCDQIVDEWQRWILKIPALIHPSIIPPDIYGARNLRGSIANPVIIDGVKVIMVAFPPFKKLEDNVMTVQIRERDSYLLLPILTAEASTEEYPSLKQEKDLVEMVKKQSNEVKNLNLKIDGIERIGCHVQNYKRMPIDEVPSDNVMGIPPEAMKPNQTVEIVHDGFFALVNVNKLGPGDHLITIIGTGGTYLNAAMIVLNVLI
jgi:hypothetical protein